MPGIAGIISNRPANECQRLVQSMIDCMHYESFYGSGTCFVPEIGVYGGWVAHEDPSQPVNLPSLNGMTELSCFLESVSHFCSSHATVLSENQGNHYGADDLLCLYEKNGASFITQLNGLFSGLLVDRRQQRTLLFNDRYGIERLYYYEKMKRFTSPAKLKLY